tara:strand:+ start:879 stop:1118 length:240 start_codon:yes stop_codon:yes gene_type:complete
MIYNVVVKRPYASKDDKGQILTDKEGNTIMKPGWTNIGSAMDMKTGISVHLDFQPLTTDGRVEQLFFFERKAKGDTSDA